MKSQALETSAGAFVSSRELTARRVLWIAVLLPFIYTTSRTAAEIEGGGVGLLDLVRGGGPLGLWAVSHVISPPIRRGNGITEIAISGFILVAFATAFVADNPDARSTLFKAVALTGAYLALARLVRMYPTTDAALRGLAVFPFVVLVAAGVQFFAFRSDVYVLSGIRGESERLNLLVPQISANPLALVAAAGLIAVVFGVTPRWWGAGLTVRLATAAAFIAVLYLCRTRSAIVILGTILVLGLLWWARRRPVVPVFLFLGAGIASLTSIPRFSDQIESYFVRNQTEQGLSTLTGRTEIWAAALDVWRDHPLFGVGYFTGHRLGIPGLNAEQSNIDSTWIETLVDVGILGGLLLAVFVLAGLSRLVRAEASPHVKTWAVSVAVVCLAVSFVNPTIQSPGPAQLLMAYLLLATIPRTTVRTEHASTRSQRTVRDSHPMARRARHPVQIEEDLHSLGRSAPYGRRLR